MECSDTGPNNRTGTGTGPRRGAPERRSRGVHTAHQQRHKHTCSQGVEKLASVGTRCPGCQRHPQRYVEAAEVDDRSTALAFGRQSQLHLGSSPEKFGQRLGAHGTQTLVSLGFQHPAVDLPCHGQSLSESHFSHQLMAGICMWTKLPSNRELDRYSFQGCWRK